MPKKAPCSGLTLPLVSSTTGTCSTVNWDSLYSLIAQPESSRNFSPSLQPKFPHIVSSVLKIPRSMLWNSSTIAAGGERILMLCKLGSSRGTERSSYNCRGCEILLTLKFESGATKLDRSLSGLAGEGMNCSGKQSKAFRIGFQGSSLHCVVFVKL